MSFYPGGDGGPPAGYPVQQTGSSRYEMPPGGPPPPPAGYSSAPPPPAGYASAPPPPPPPPPPAGYSPAPPDPYAPPPPSSQVPMPYPPPPQYNQPAYPNTPQYNQPAYPNTPQSNQLAYANMGYPSGYPGAPPSHGYIPGMAGPPAFATGSPYPGLAPEPHQGGGGGYPEQQLGSGMPVGYAPSPGPPKPSATYNIYVPPPAGPPQAEFICQQPPVAPQMQPYTPQIVPPGTAGHGGVPPAKQQTQNPFLWVLLGCATCCCCCELFCC